MLFNAICENRIPLKISEFTVIYTNDCERINHGSLKFVISVNVDIFQMVLISRNFKDVKFGENKILVKCQNHSVIY